MSNEPGTPLTITAQRLEIPLRVTFKQASFERKTGESVWVEARRGREAGLGEGCPRSYVTGEDIAGALDWIAAHAGQIQAQCTSLDTLQAWRSANRAAAERDPAAWCAVETALLDLFAREAQCSVEQLLGLQGPAGRFRYTGILSDAPLDELGKLLTRYLGMGFRDFKLKLNGTFETDDAAIRLFRQMTAEHEVRLRADANNLWSGVTDKAIDYLGRLGADLFAIEEPLAARAFGELSRLSVATGLPIIIDESCARASDVTTAAALPGTWIANIKISKAGGLLGSLEILAAARQNGWPVIVGAHVGETSVMTRCGLVIAAAAGEDLAAHEGGFGTLAIDHDPVAPLLMFGAGGILDMAATANDFPGGWQAGLGLQRKEHEA